MSFSGLIGGATLALNRRGAIIIIAWKRKKEQGGIGKTAYNSVCLLDKGMTAVC